MSVIDVPTTLIGDEGIDREIALLESRYMELPRAIVRSKLMEKEGDIAYNSLEMSRSVICYYDAIQLNSANHRAHAKLMRSFYLLDDDENLDKALGFFRSHLDSIYDTSALLIVGEVYANLGRDEEVRRILDRLVNFREESALRWVNIARLAHSIGEMRIANMAYEEAYGLDGRNPLVVSSYIYYHLFSGDRDRAMAILRNRLLLDPKELLYWELLEFWRKDEGNEGPFLPNYAPFDNLCNVFTTTDQTSVRLARAKTVLLDEPENIVALYVLGESYMDLQEYKNAEIHFRKLLEIDPGNHVLRSRINVLQEIAR